MTAFPDLMGSDGVGGGDRQAFDLRPGSDLHADHCGMLSYLGGLDATVCPFPIGHRQRMSWMLGYYSGRRLYGPKGYLRVPASLQAEANEFVAGLVASVPLAAAAE